MLPNTISQDRGKDWTSLHEASANGNEQMIKTLLAGNADITAKETKLGNTPLHEAASRGFSRSVKLLCTPKPSAKPTSKSKQKKDDASKQSRGPAQNAMLSIQNFAGFTALHLAAQNGHNQSCRELLLAGANADVENYYGDTALHTACRYGHAGAARILISAFCDVNKKNLNGDTPLHITSAMGRHKLSRILLEAECEINTRNSQCETPRDIAIRKGFGKILDILDNPHRIRNKKDKPDAGEDEKVRGGACASKAHSNEVSWSPYGCHYFPDMRAFPSPKLETLPKEPLKRGEQYYLDLAGHIRKGPIGIGNTCYCGPFFKHIEDKINSNKRHLRKYVHNAKEHLDDKVQALAARTNHQIEKLTRTMIAERVECENRRIYLENYLKRGGPLRLTADVASKGKEAREMMDTLKRCRSLEFLEKVNVMESKMANSRSFDLLDANANEAMGVSLRGDQTHCCVHTAEQPNQLNEDPNNEFYDVSKRLGSLLAKTSTFLKVPPTQTDAHYAQPPAASTEQALDIDTTNDDPICTRLENMHLSPSASDVSNVTPAQLSSETGAVSSPDYNRNFRTTLAAAERKAIVASPEGIKTASSMAVSPSERPHRDKQLEYLYDIQKRGSVIQNVISALRKSHQRTDALMDVKTRNESEYQQEDKLGYKDELFQVHRLTDSDSREAEMLKEVGLPLENVNAREPYNLHHKSTFALQMNDYIYKNNTQSLLKTMDQTPQSTLGVRNQDSSYTESHPGEDCLDSLENVQQQQQQQMQYSSSQSSPLYAAQQTCDKKSMLLHGSTSSKAADSPDSQNYVFQTNYWPERYVPKDAYFHDLSQRKCRIAQTAALNATTAAKSAGLTNAIPKFNVANAVKSIESLNGQALANTYIRDPTARSSITNTKALLVSAAAKSQSCVACTDAVCNGNCSYNTQAHTVSGAHSPHSGYIEGRRGSQPVEAGNLALVTQSTNFNETRIVTTAAVHNGGSYRYDQDESDALNSKTRLPASGYYASNVSSLV
ncbi:uncharacterized protein dgo isoform X2 [Eurosta solidaginis]